MNNLFNNISINTKQERLRFLKKIGVNDLNDYEVLYDIDNIFNNFILTSNSKGTQKTRIFHIIEFLKLTSNNDLLELYKEKAQPIIKQAIDKEKSNITNKEHKYIKLEELQNKLLSSKPDIITIKQFEKLKYNEQIQFANKLQDYILLSLYVFTPAIRNNYWTLNIIKKQSDYKDKNDNLNYMIINNVTVYLYLQSYKNYNSLGAMKIEIHKSTQKLIRLFYKIMNILLQSEPNNFLYHISLNKIEPLKENATKSKIIELSNKYFNSPLSINDYRHIWEIQIQTSDEYKNMSYKEKEKIHNKLLHSIDTALKYNIL